MSYSAGSACTSTYHPAIFLREQTQRAVLSGTKIGSWQGVGTQDCAVEVRGATTTSVTSFAITGNSFFNNRYNKVCNPGNSGVCGSINCSQQRVIANNSCGVNVASSPPSGYCHYAQTSY